MENVKAQKISRLTTNYIRDLEVAGADAGEVGHALTGAIVSYVYSLTAPVKAPAKPLLDAIVSDIYTCAQTLDTQAQKLWDEVVAERTKGA